MTAVRHAGFLKLHKVKQIKDLSIYVKFVDSSCNRAEVIANLTLKIILESF